MSNDKLSAPVGRSPRHGNGEEVRNNADDVDLLRRMLRANGLMVAETGAVEGGLLKAIEAAQKKAGIKNPDGVVDPVGKTADWLRPKFVAAEKALAKEQEEVQRLKMVELTLEGQKLTILQKEHDKLISDTLDRLERYVKTIIRQDEMAQYNYRHYLDVLTLQKGLANMVVHAVILKAYSVETPDAGVANRSARAAMALQRAMNKRSLDALIETLPEAEAAINAFCDEMGRFLREFGESADSFGFYCKLTSDSCFAVAGALASAALAAPAAGWTMARAMAVSNAGVSALSSMSKELGAHASGQDVTLAGSLGRIAVDTTFSIFTSWLTNKIPASFLEGTAKYLGMRFAAQFPGIAAPQVKMFFFNYLSGSGTEVVKAAISETVSLLGKSVKKWEAPSQKDFDEAYQNVLVALISGGLMKNMGGFFKNWETDADLYVSRKVIPDLLKQEVKPGSLTDKQTRKLIGDVTQAVSGEVSKAGIGVVVEAATGNESAKELSDIAIRGIAKDRTIEALVIKEIEKALKKLKL
jgi:signal recognition particle subunit SEC65